MVDTPAGSGALTYAITAGNETDAFAIGDTTGQLTVTVTLSADSEREVTISVTVTLQDVAEAADYDGVPASVTIAAGAISASFAVTAVDDTTDDDAEAIQLGFGTDLPVGVTVATAADAVTTTPRSA